MRNLYFKGFLITFKLCRIESLSIVIYSLVNAINFTCIISFIAKSSMLIDFIIFKSCILLNAWAIINYVNSHYLFLQFEKYLIREYKIKPLEYAIFMLFYACPVILFFCI